MLTDLIVEGGRKTLAILGSLCNCSYFPYVMVAWSCLSNKLQKITAVDGILNGVSLETFSERET